MIKLIAKKGNMKAILKGEARQVTVEVVHAAVRMVEKLIEADKVMGYAAGATIIEELTEIVPELKRGEKEESKG